MNSGVRARRLANPHPVADAVLKQVDAKRLAFELSRLEYALLVGLQTLWPAGQAFDLAASPARLQKLCREQTPSAR